MGIQGYLIAFTQFLNDFVIPTIFALAFLFFLWNAARYFIFHSNEDTGRESARQLAIYGILAFVITLSLWGVVNLLLYTFGISELSNSLSTPDYMQSRSGAGGAPGTGSTGGYDANDGYVDPTAPWDPNEGYADPGQAWDPNTGYVDPGTQGAGEYGDALPFNEGGSPI